MGIYGNYYIVHKMSENVLIMIDLFLTLDNCWVPPWWFDALKSVSVLDFGHFRHAPKWPISPKMVIFKIFCSTPTFSTISKTKSVQAMQVVSTLKWNNNIGNRNVKYSISDWIVKMSAAWVSCASGNVYFQCINSDHVSQSVAFWMHHRQRWSLIAASSVFPKQQLFVIERQFTGNLTFPLLMFRSRGENCSEGFSLFDKAAMGDCAWHQPAK